MAVAALLLGTSGCTGQRDGAELTITQVLHEQARAWNRGDIDGFMEHYWKSDELTFSSGGQTTQGWSATLANYKKKYPTREAMGDLSFSDLRFRSIGQDAVLVLGRWRLNRNSDSVGGNFSLVFQRMGGCWLIVHDHTSRSSSTDETLGSD